MVSNFRVVIHILNLFSIEHYLRQFCAEFRASIAIIKRLSVLQTFGHS